jgi:hypothetical protein
MMSGLCSSCVLGAHTATGGDRQRIGKDRLRFLLLGAGLGWQAGLLSTLSVVQEGAL